MDGLRMTLHWVVRPLVMGMTAVALTGCTDTTGTQIPVQVGFDVAPGEVFPGAPLVATLTLTNPGQRTVVYPGDPFCGGALSVMDAPPGDAMVGTRVFCIAVVTETVLTPGEVRTWTWDLRAEWESGAPLAPGRYQLVMDWEAADLEVLIVPFDVSTWD